jgi:urease accessory protein
VLLKHPPSELRTFREPQHAHHAHTSWHAQLDLKFEATEDAHTQSFRTNLKHQHVGPLRIQKALYPDGPSCCHALILHPPDGIASGDQLAINVVVNKDAHALITTPGASKWYGAFESGLATQTINMNVAGCLEWLPTETIVFNDAHAKSHFDITVQPDGHMICWDLLIFGRAAKLETFQNGCFDQTLSIKLDDDLVWVDRLYLKGGDPLFQSPVGLRGHYALSTCWAVAPKNHSFKEEQLHALRLAAPNIAFTLIHPRVLVGRQLSDPISLRKNLEIAWHRLKTDWLNMPAVPPRIWST